MAVQYRKLTENDLETFIEMRIRQLREEGATEEIDLEPALFDYYRRHMSDAPSVDASNAPALDTYGSRAKYAR